MKPGDMICWHGADGAVLPRSVKYLYPQQYFDGDGFLHVGGEPVRVPADLTALVVRAVQAKKARRDRAAVLLLTDQGLLWGWDYWFRTVSPGQHWFKSVQAAR